MREMMLGKRPRPPMRRTTSMAWFSPDLGAAETSPAPDQELIQPNRKDRQKATKAVADVATAPRGKGRRSSGDLAVVETAHFLRACGLCKRRLGPGRDTFMYRGDIAFCSQECRQQQISLDERNESKCSLTSMKKDAAQATAAGSEASGSGGEMVAAA